MGGFPSASSRLSRLGALVASASLVLAGMAIVVSAPSPAQAAIVSTTGPAGAGDIATALAAPSAHITGASWVTTPGGTPNGVSTDALTQLPTQGPSFGILTTGDVNKVVGNNITNGTPGTGNGGGPVHGQGTDRDVSILQVDLDVPQAANCLSFDFKFLSQEFPGYVGGGISDAFVAELDTDDWTDDNHAVVAPHNFAFDTAGHAINVSSLSLGLAAAQGAGTSYDADQHGIGGATQLLHAATQVTPGAHSVYFSIFDDADVIYDSAVFLDNLATGFVSAPEVNCTAGAAIKNYTMTMTPGTDSSTVGGSHSVTATLTDAAGDPVPEAPIAFSTSGANTKTGTATTDAQGRAAFSYTGIAAGDDAIGACYQPEGASACLATASATQTWKPGSPTIDPVTSTGSAAGGSVVGSTAVTGGYHPSGTVAFSLYAPKDTDCEGAPVYSGTTSLDGLTAKSGVAPVGAAGTYHWIAAYSGDANNSPVSSACSAGPAVVGKATPAIEGTPSGPTTSGGTVSESATVSAGYQPTGTVIFALYGPTDTTCAGPALHTGSATLDSSGNAASGEQTVTEPGIYHWTAAYSGDANNETATTPCESSSVTVAKATPEIRTAPSTTVPVGGALADSATVSGGNHPTGTVTFALFGPADASCSDEPLATRTAALDGSSTAGSGDIASTGAGTYHWTARYSGDEENVAVGSGCGDATVVAKASPSVEITPSAAVAVGHPVSATALVSGGYAVAGHVTFSLYGPGDDTCSADPVASSAGTLDASGAARSQESVAESAGAYHWRASFAGNADNEPAASACGDGEVAVAKASPSLSVTTPSEVVLGKSFQASALLAGGYKATGQVTFELFRAGDSGCEKPPITSSTAQLTADAARSDAVAPKAAGIYHWKASYSGDAANESAATGCAASSVTVTAAAPPAPPRKPTPPRKPVEPAPAVTEPAPSASDPAPTTAAEPVAVTGFGGSILLGLGAVLLVAGVVLLVLFRRRPSGA